MNTSFNSHLFELETYGFTILDRALDEIYSENLKQEIDLILQSKHEGCLINLVAKSPVFFNLIDFSPVLNIVESILSPNVILAHLNGRIIEPHSKAQALHSDIPFALANTEKPLALNVAFLIDEFTNDNGATVILPLSHWCKKPGPPDNLPTKYLYKMTAPKGSILIFYSNCWHGSSENTTDLPRRAIFAQYRLSHWMRFHFNPHVGFDKEWHSLLNERQRKLLRMESGVGVDNSSDLLY